jgi:lysophospholipase L1-like esterase
VPLFAVLGAAMVAGLLSSEVGAAPGSFVTAWSTAMAGVTTVAGSNYTCRFAARSSVAGDAVEVRLSNAMGRTPLTVAAASAGILGHGEGLTGPARPLTFAGSRSLTIPPGGDALSDPTPLRVRTGEDVAVSVYIAAANQPASLHGLALETNACTVRDGTAGDHTADVRGNAFRASGRFDWWLDAVAVRSAAAAGTVVAMGDSITDGKCSGFDAHGRWTDVLAARLGGSLGVANQGIAANRLEGVLVGPDAVTRLQRDVLSLPGASTLILFEGSNDIAYGASAATVLGAMRQIVAAAHDAGLHVVGATVVPRSGSLGWTPQMEAYRQQVNTVIRRDTLFDQYVDFDRVLGDGAATPMLQRAFDCGDHVHPSAAAHAAMGAAVPLADLQ